MASLLDRTTQLQLARGVTGRLTDLLDDAVAVSLDALVEERGGPALGRGGVRAAPRRRAARRRGARRGPPRDRCAGARLGQPVPRAARRPVGPAHRTERRRSRRTQLERLTGAGFLSRAGTDHLPHLPRYLAAVEHRVDRLRTAPRRDLEHVTELAGLMTEIDRAAASLPRERAGEIERIRWMVEELRVSTFAQQLGTAHPVSAKRIRRALADVVAGERG